MFLDEDNNRGGELICRNIQSHEFEKKKKRKKETKRRIDHLREWHSTFYIERCNMNIYLCTYRHIFISYTYISDANKHEKKK